MSSNAGGSSGSCRLRQMHRKTERVMRPDGLYWPMGPTANKPFDLDLMPTVVNQEISRGIHSSLRDPQKGPDIPMFLPGYPHKLLKRLHLGLSKDEGTSNYIWCQLGVGLCSNAKLYSCILGLAPLSRYLPPTLCRC